MMRNTTPESVYHLIDKSFSAHGAREIARNLRTLRADLTDEEFNGWLIQLSVFDISKLLCGYHLSQQ